MGKLFQQIKKVLKSRKCNFNIQTLAESLVLLFVKCYIKYLQQKNPVDSETYFFFNSYLKYEGKCIMFIEGIANLDFLVKGAVSESLFSTLDL